jgi:hypothetical protein
MRRFRQRIASALVLLAVILRRWWARPSGVEADLGGGGDVDHVVHPAVPGAGEAVSDDLSGGGFDGGGAGPRGVPVAVGEPGDVAGVGQGASSDDGADPGQVHQGGA